MEKVINIDPKEKKASFYNYGWLFVGLTGFSLSLTILYLAMRAVMDVGGFCAEGGAYQINVHCPGGVAYLTPLSIFGLIIFGTIYVLNLVADAFNFSLLFWTALFGTLGWNFLDYSIQSLKKGEISFGWWICVIVFFLLAIGPVLIADRRIWDLLVADRQKMERKRIREILLLIFQLLAIAWGIWGGIWLVRIT